MPINPIQMMQLISQSGNPKQMVLNVLQQQAQADPKYQQLLNYAMNNDGRGVEEFVRQDMASHGVNFDKEFNAFRKQWGL